MENSTKAASRNSGGGGSHDNKTASGTSNLSTQKKSAATTKTTTGNKKVNTEVSKDEKQKMTKNQTSTSAASNSKSVSFERKEELLMEARVNRLEWIYRVPFPYRISSSGIKSSVSRCYHYYDDSDGEDTDTEDSDNNTKQHPYSHPQYHSQHPWWNENERLSAFSKSNYAYSRMSSVPLVLSHLYGMYDNQSASVTADQIADRIEAMIGPIENQKQISMLSQEANNMNSSGSNKKHPNSNNNTLLLYEHELAKENVDKAVLTSYGDFWNKLQTPECALLVQGMRNFVRNLQQKYKREDYITASNARAKKIQEENDNNASGSNNESDQEHSRLIEALANTLKSYLESTYQSLKSHVAWKKSGVDEYVRRSLESFIYGQCYPILSLLKKEKEDEQQQSSQKTKKILSPHSSSGLLWTKATIEEDEKWYQRLLSLQFITPKHLEIDCLVNLEVEADDDANAKLNESATADEKLALKQTLKIPIDALLSIDKYYSPLEKLNRILAIFQGVNSALSNVLNNSRNKAPGSSNKLPSADDVLPTIILVVLLAKPKHLLTNLNMIDVFCPTSYLRGEAGYAYTNLFGAVQFLQDIDINVDPEIDSDSGGASHKSLLITSEEFRKGILKQQQKLHQKLKSQAIITGTANPTESSSSSEVSLDYLIDIPVQLIREARLRGEITDLEWALRWQQEQLHKRKELEGEFIDQQQQSQQQIRHSPTKTGFGNQQDNNNNNSSMLPSSNLSSFSRNYSFLTTRPEDIRISDLPQLLAEYKMLVHTTEVLLGERAAIVANEKKQKHQQIEKQLMEQAVAEFIDDPSFLTGATNDNNSNSNNNAHAATAATTKQQSQKTKQKQQQKPQKEQTQKSKQQQTSSNKNNKKASDPVEV